MLPIKIGCPPKMGYHGNINNKRFCNLTIVYGNAEINYEQHAFRELDNWKLWLICLQFILSFFKPTYDIWGALCINMVERPDMVSGNPKLHPGDPSRSLGIPGVWNAQCSHIHTLRVDNLVGGLEHGFYLSIQLGMSSSKLTNSYSSTNESH